MSHALLAIKPECVKRQRRILYIGDVSDMLARPLAAQGHNISVTVRQTKKPNEGKRPAHPHRSSDAEAALD